MDVTDQYPSTADYRPIKGGQDATLVILEGARKRYKRGASREEYIGAGGIVCAVGAVAREAGVKPSVYEDATRDLGEDFDAVLVEAKIEREVRNAAKKAIKLLNQAALRLYPSVAKERFGNPISWSGPLERLNQNSEWDFSETKKAVLACYDEAIKRHKNNLERRRERRLEIA